MTDLLSARLRAYVQRSIHVPADVDDVLQTVFAKLVDHGDRVAHDLRPAWLFTVARRAIADFYRARNREPKVVEIETIDPEVPIPESLREVAHCLLPVLQDLAAEDRDLLRRVDMEGESQADVARLLGMSHSALKSRVQRARARLRTAFDACCELEFDGQGMPIHVRPRTPRPDCCGGGCDPDA